MLSLRFCRAVAALAVLACAAPAALFLAPTPARAQATAPVEPPPPASVAPALDEVAKLQAAGKFAEAVKLLQDRQVALSATTTDAEKRAVVTALADACFAWGKDLSGKREYNEAIAKYEMAFTLNKTKPRRAAATLHNIGFALGKLKKYSESLVYYKKALLLRQQANDTKGKALTLANIGAIYQAQAKYNEALDYYKQASTLHKSESNVTGEASASYGIGVCYELLKKYNEALTYYKQSLALRQQVKDVQGEAVTSTNIGDVHYRRAEYSEAEMFYKQATLLFHQTKDADREANVWNRLGSVYDNQSLYKEALRCFREALPLYKQVGNSEEERMTLNNIGVLYVRLGSYNEGIDAFKELLPLWTKEGKVDYEAQTLVNIGAAYRHAGRNNEATTYLERAALLFEQVNNPEGEIAVLNNLSGVYYNRKKYDDALNALLRAIPLLKKTLNSEGEYTTRSNIGRVYQEKKQFDKSLSSYEQALQLARQLQSVQSEGVILNNLMSIWGMPDNPQRNIRLATFYGKQSINLFQFVRENNKGLKGTLQTSYKESVSGSYRDLADLLIAEGRLGEAEQVLNLLKDDEVTRYLQRGSAVLATMEKVSLTPQEKAFTERYRAVADKITKLGAEKDALEKKRAGASLSAADGARLETLNERLREANKAFLAFLAEMDRTFRAGDGGGRDSRVVAMQTGAQRLQGILKQIQTQTGKRTAALYTLSGKDEYRVILVTPSTLTAGVNDKPLPSAELNAKIEAFRAVLRDPTLDPKPLAQELYKLLIGGPIGKDLANAKIETLLCSLDGSLRYLPIGALHDGEKYLAERYCTSLFTPTITDGLTTGGGAVGRVLAVGVTEGATVNGKTFGPLPGAGAEVKMAASGADDLPLLDKAFTRKATEAALRKTTFPLVHIASHFALDPASGRNSFLLLGDGSAWMLADIDSDTRLFEGVQLLLLSACETGVGDGAEVDALGDAALKQGAQAVVATLWPVSDPSTAALMGEFYRLRRANPALPKSEALRLAQVALLNGSVPVSGLTRGVVGSTAGDAPGAFAPDPAKPCAHPFYWAAFVLIGNGL